MGNDIRMMPYKYNHAKFLYYQHDTIIQSNLLLRSPVKALQNWLF